MENKANNTSPLVFNGKRLTRQFGGKTENFSGNKERNFFGKMIRAYKKGWSKFQIGIDQKTKKPIYTNVMQTYYYV